MFMRSAVATVWSKSSGAASAIESSQRSAVE
jgi:hypothetical protein